MEYLHDKKFGGSRLTSTKELEGERRDGILYLDKGIGTGKFLTLEERFRAPNTGSTHIIPNVSSKKDYYEG